MKTIKTAALTGAALDYAVALCEALDVYMAVPGGHAAHITSDGKRGSVPKYSTCWAHGGPIIEREKISLIRADDDYATDSRGYTTTERIPVWAAEHGGGHSVYSCYEGQHYEPQYEVSEDSCSYGPTALIAAMRCFVLRRKGLEVSVPDSLA
jgi:hypothetical protein